MMEAWRPTLVTDKHKLFCSRVRPRHHAYACGSADDGESVSMGVWRYCGHRQGSPGEREQRRRMAGLRSGDHSALVLLRTDGEERNEKKRHNVKTRTNKAPDPDNRLLELVTAQDHRA